MFWGIQSASPPTNTITRHSKYKTYQKVEINHPLDDYIIQVIAKWYDEYQLPYVHPNIITLFRIGLFFSVAFWYSNVSNKAWTANMIFIGTFILNYILDTLDGYLARKYNKETELGDYLDHVGDLTIGFITLYIASPLSRCQILFLTCGFILLVSYIGGTQKLYNPTERNVEILDYFKRFDFLPLEISRYFSYIGFYTIFILIFIQNNVL